MRIVFDKHVPYPLPRYLAKHDVRTAEEMGWARLVNGDLLRAAEDAGFGVMAPGAAIHQERLGRSSLSEQVYVHACDEVNAGDRKRLQALVVGEEEIDPGICRACKVDRVSR